MHNYQTLTVHSDHHITTITLNRPTKKNAMNFVMVRELIHVGKRLKHDRNTRAVILTGSGDNFCSGLDLTDLNNPKSLRYALWQLAKPTPSDFQKACLIWQSLPMPVIAVIDGVCLGAGLQLMMGADIRIATPTTRFAILESKWGLVFDMGLIHTAYHISPDVLQELAMSARMFDAQSAKTNGFVSHLSDTPKVLADTLIAEFNTRSPDAILAVKRLVHARHTTSALTLYQEKLWQIKLLLGNNRKLALKKAKDTSVEFLKRQFK